MKDSLSRRYFSIILISFVFCAALLSSASADEPKSNAESYVNVQAEGKGDGKDARAHDDAFKEAKRLALEQAFGVYLNSETLTENYQTKYDRILVKSSGYIRKAQIEKEWQDEEFTYIRILAEVSMADIRQDGDAIKFLIDAVGKPKLLILGEEKIKNKKTDGNIVQIALEEKLIDLGFTVIDKTQMEEIKSRDVALYLDDYDKAAALGKRYNADIVVIYNSNSDSAGSQEIMGNTFQKFKTMITARIIYTDSAEVIGTAKTEYLGGASGEQAARNTISSAAKILPDAVIDKLLRGLKDAPKRVELFINGVEYEEADEIYSALKKLRNVDSVTQPTTTGGIAYYQLSGQISGGDISKGLLKMSKFKIKPKNVSPKRVDADFEK